MDDIRLFKLIPIDIRGKHEQPGVLIEQPVIQRPIHGQFQRPAAMSAFALNVKGQLLPLPQSPLHEGRRQRVLRSSAVEALTAAESDQMRRAINRHRVGPGDRPGFVSPEEEELMFQVVQD